MKGKIVEKSGSAANGEKVTLLTAYGSLVGRWHGASAKLGGTVHVEINVTTVETVHGTDHGPFSATSPGPDEVRLVGTIERWADELLDLRIGDSLVQLELAPAPHRAGGWLEVKGKGVELFDTNL